MTARASIHLTCPHCGQSSVVPLGAPEARIESRSVPRWETGVKGEPAPTFIPPKSNARVCGCGHEEVWHELVQDDDATPMAKRGACTYGHDKATRGCDCPGFHSRRRGTPKTKSETSGSPKPNGVSKCQRAILAALVLRGKPSTSAQVAILSGYSLTSGGFGSALADNRAAGLMTGGASDLEVTAAGRKAAGDVAPIGTGAQVLDYWTNRLGPCAGAILQVLTAAYPKELGHEDLAARTGYRATSGGFGSALAKLRKLELVDGLRASDDLMQAVNGS